MATFCYSAGGHLALLSGLRDSRVKAIVAGAAPTDLELYEQGDLVKNFLGGTLRDQPRRYRDASPIYQVHKRSPPAFLYHGTRNSQVPPVHAELMMAGLERYRVPHELHWVPGKGHVATFLPGREAEEHAINFLDQILKGSPALRG